MSNHRHEPSPSSGDRSASVGLVVNPMSGRDVRRLVGRAQSETPESKRNQLQRAVIGAAAAGAGRFCWVRDLFRVTERAIEYVRVGAEFDCLDIGPLQTSPDDTVRAVHGMRDAGCRVLLVLGGDGTNRVVAGAWSDAVLLPVSTGTNNVFPEHVEPTLAGAAAGLVASGRVPVDEVAPRAKLVRVRYQDGEERMGVIDAVLVHDDHPGSLLPFNASKIRRVVLSRAEPTSVGMSPIGGLLEPCGRDDDFGVVVRCVAPGEGGTPLLAPISPGIYRTAHVDGCERIPLGEPVLLEGPGLVEFDGDRERVLAEGETAEVRVVRDGPRVIDVARTLSYAAEHGLYVDRPHWHDEGDLIDGMPGCC